MEALVCLMLSQAPACRPLHGRVSSAASPGSSGDQRSGAAGGGSSPVSSGTREHFLEGGAEVEGQGLAAFVALACPFGFGRRLVRAAVVVEHDADPARLLARDEPEGDSRTTASTGRSSRSFQPPPPAVR